MYPPLELIPLVTPDIYQSGAQAASQAEAHFKLLKEHEAHTVQGLTERLYRPKKGLIGGVRGLDVTISRSNF